MAIGRAEQRVRRRRLTAPCRLVAQRERRVGELSPAHGAWHLVGVVTSDRGVDRQGFVGSDLRPRARPMRVATSSR